MSEQIQVDKHVYAVYNKDGRFKTKAISRPDYGRVLVLQGVELPESYQVYFATTSNGGQAKGMIGNANGVEIPDEYVQSGKTIYAWYFLHADENSGQNVFLVIIPNNCAALHDDDEPTPVEQSQINDAIVALQQALYEAGVTVSHYPKVENGYWYTWYVDDGIWVNTGVKAQGDDGQDGTDGYSPTVSVTEIAGGHRVSITDKNGTQTFDVEDGASDAEGQDGFSPEVEMEKSGNTVTLSITDKNGTSTVQIEDGADGQNGADGYSPTATVSKSQGTATIQITDKNGTTIAEVSDGSAGTDGYSPTATVEKFGDTAVITITDKNGTTTAQITDGSNGSPGQGIASGGTDGQMLVKDGSTNYVTKWQNQPTIPTVATSAEVKAGSASGAFIAPSVQDASAFYALAKAAGNSDQASSSNAVGVYTSDALVKIQKMLGIYEAPWELIREDTFTNATEKTHQITVDGNGQPFELTDALLMFEIPVQENAASANGNLVLTDGTTNIASVYCGAISRTAGQAALGIWIIAEERNGLVFVHGRAPATNVGNIFQSYKSGFEYNAAQGILESTNFIVRGAKIANVLGTGHYKLYGKRKWS